MPKPESQTTSLLIDHRLKLVVMKAELNRRGDAIAASYLEKDIAETNRLLELAIKNEGASHAE